MSIETYALINSDGYIVNTVLWDGDTDTWSPEDGLSAVLCGDSICEIGGAHKDGVFARAPTPEPTHEEYVTEAEEEKSSLMAEAAGEISPLQDAVDLDMATDEEKEQLAAWKKYRVLLNRIDTSSAPDITWPTKPE